VAPLHAWLGRHAEEKYSETHALALEHKVDAKKEGYPFRTYGYEQVWKAVGTTDHALILEGNGYVFTGGAHGLPFTISMIWVLTLNKQRAEKRDGSVKLNTGISHFDTCVAITDGEIIPISKTGQALDALRVVIGPYTAGPYAEGSYAIELPMDEKLMAAVRPEYQGWFAQGTP